MKETMRLWNWFAGDALRLPTEAVGVGWDILERMYAGRPYHNLDHVVGMVKQLHEWCDVPRETTPSTFNSGVVECAAWFHDAVYDVGAPKGQNEKRSAELACLFLRGAGIDHTEFLETVRDCILATQHHDEPQSPTQCMIVDLDLAGLASAPDVYATNSANIRAEYGNLVWEEWRKGRIAFLQDMLSRKRLYWTAPGSEWEAKARANMERELDGLQAGLGRSDQNVTQSVLSLKMFKNVEVTRIDFTL